MLRIIPGETPLPHFHEYLLGVVAPRPIAFVSTVDHDSNPNLSPFSFFNAFSSRPPVCIFSPARRGKDGTTKHTYENVRETREAVINVVSYNIVRQASLASSEFPRGISEFVKAGLTPIASVMVRPPRVKESSVQMECKVRDVIELGTQSGSGNLVICEILLMHINEEVLDERGKINPHKMDLVARMGENWYCRASGNAVFEVDKPGAIPGIGVDGIPEHIRYSNVLTGNNLGQLGNAEKLPSAEEVERLREKALGDIFTLYSSDSKELERQLHLRAKKLLEEGNRVAEAWMTLLALTVDT